MACNEDKRQAAADPSPPAISAQSVLKILAIILAVATALWMLYRLRAVVLLLIASVFFSYLIAPIVQFFEKPISIRGRPRKLPRTVAILASYFTITLFAGLMIYSFASTLAAQTSAFAAQLPEYVSKLKVYEEKLDRLYQGSHLPPAWRNTLMAETNQISDNAFRWVEAGVLGIIARMAWLPWLILIPILAFFTIRDAETFRKMAIAALPTRRLRRRIDELFSDASQALAAYIRAQMVACIIVGAITGIGFKVLGAPYPLALGVMAGIFEFVPLAGPVSAGLISVLVSATVSVKTALFVLIFLLVFRVAEDYIIYPRLIGRGLEMHPLAIIVAVLSGAELGGVIGIFLAIPTIALITVSYRHWMEYRGGKGIVANLLEPSAPPPADSPPAEPKPCAEAPTDPLSDAPVKTA